MAQSEVSSDSRAGPSRLTALGILSASIMGYVFFLAQGYGEDLYQWSKTLAPYSVRQYLDMSKRYALQYGHLFFLLIILFCTKYLVTSDRTWAPLSRAIQLIRPHSMPVFLFHVPFLYFFAGLWGHDPGDTVHQVALLILTLIACVFAGKLCVSIKRYFDRFEHTVGIGFKRVLPKDEVKSARKPPTLTRSYSDFLHVLQILAMVTVFVGHFTYQEFSSWEPPGIAAWRRWAVPFFFMVSGYMALMGFDKRAASFGDMIANRLVGMWYMVVPLLILTPILDHIGYAITPSIYMENEKFIDPVMGTGGPVDVLGFLITFTNSALYLNEIFLYKWAGFGTPVGGMRAFSNDAFWFLCYLIPYMLMLTVAMKMRGLSKYLVLAVLILLAGPPIMFLAPLFFGGCIVYLLHCRYDGIRR